MGKDKAPKQAAPSISVASNKAEEKKPVARGHRQRGAGTVITAKPTVVTNDGVVLKAHEKLPSRLLLEYCQREKRPNPKYFPNPPGTRMKVVLEDAKNSKNDLTFSPVQTFETDTVARDFAALLALFHFQKTIPLERTLPEPYSTTWTEMVAASKGQQSASGNAATPAPPKSVPNSATPTVKEQKQDESIESGNSKSAKQKGGVGVPVLDRATADWLCDSCGIQNFAKTAAGIPRTKCFRCQSPKSDKCSLVAPANAVDTSNKSQKVAPKAVVNLRAQQEFASKAESEKAAQQKRTNINRRLTFFDALKRSNRPKAIHISPAIRMRLEKLFGITPIHELSSKWNLLDECIENVCDAGLISSEDSGLSNNTQAQLLREVCSYFQSNGFSIEVIMDCLNGVVMAQGDVLNEDFMMQANSDSGEAPQPQELFKLLVSSMMEKSIGTKAVSTLKGVSNAANQNVPASPVLAVLSSYGWPKNHLTQYLEEQLSKIVGEEALLELLELDCGTIMMSLLLHALLVQASYSQVSDVFIPLKTFVESFKTTGQPNDDDAAEGNSTLEDEIMSMEAILPEQFTYRAYSFSTIPTAVTCFTLQDIEITLPNQKKSLFSMSLSFTAAQRSRYPEAQGMPLVVLSTSDSAVDYAILQELNAAIYWKLNGLNGNMIMYELFSWLMNYEFSAASVTKKGFLSKGSINKVISAYTTDTIGTEENENEDDTVSEAVTEAETLTTADEQDNDSVSIATTDQDDTSIGTRGTSSSRKTKTSKSFTKVSFWTRSSSTAMFDSNKPIFAGRKSLPAWQMKQDFLQIMQQHQAMIVTGETGCGKTTQIPQFLYDENPNAKILICQPRRLAAIGVASRVAEEQFSSLGDKVGYMVKGETRMTSQTKIMFCTYGVLLRRLQDDPTLQALDYIVLDEIHERGLDSDFCLALLMNALLKRPQLKLILMSATISTQHFQTYLRTQLSAPTTIPILEIPGFTYPVQEYYKNDIEEWIRDYPISFTKIRNEDFSDEEDDEESDRRDRNANFVGGYNPTLTNNKNKGNKGNGRKRKEMDYDLLIKLSFLLIQGNVRTLKESSLQQRTAIENAEASCPNITQSANNCILVFLPGVPEINKFIQYFQLYWKDQPNPDRKRVQLIPLHSNISSAEQKKIFSVSSDPALIKVIAATNIAEASVTIPDVTVVIDTCRVKEMEYDPGSSSYSLTLQFASQDSLRQRKGRAGRVSAGRCYRLITKTTFEKKLAPHSVPEILRLSLESSLLQLFAMLPPSNSSSISSLLPPVSLLLDENNTSKESHPYYLPNEAFSLLSRCPDVPPHEAIRSALLTLLQVQAISPTVIGSTTPNYRLTSLGWYLSRLPCSPRIGKLLIYGSLLHCVYPVVCVAAAMACKSPFLATNPNATDKASAEIARGIKLAKEKFGGGKISSDYNIIVRVMMEYDQCRDSRKFCRMYGLSHDRVQEIKQAMRDYFEDLVDIGLLSSVKDGSNLTHPVYNSNAKKWNFLAGIYCAGLYPQVAKILRPPKRFIELMGAALERDVEAKELKFYVPKVDHSSSADDAGNEDIPEPNKNDFITTKHLQRVFLHPSSVNFQNAQFSSSNYVLYGEKQLVLFEPNSTGNNSLASMNSSSAKNTNNATPGTENYKLYLKDTSEITAFALLFFGGEISYDKTSGILSVDRWISFACSDRIAELVQLIRQEFDYVLAEKLHRQDDKNDSKSSSEIAVVNHAEVLTLVADMLESPQFNL